MKKRKVTFAHIGNYHYAFRTLVEKLNCEVVLHPSTNKKALEYGVKFSPEFICFPFKTNLGNYLEAIHAGADTVIMVETFGDCRFNHYAALQKKIIENLKLPVEFVIFRAKDCLKKFKSLGGTSTLEVLKALALTWQKITLIEFVESLSRYYRPRELKKGATDTVMDKMLERIGKEKKLLNFWRLKKEIKMAFSQIPHDYNSKPLKIGMVGEIYMLSDAFANHDLEKLLGYMGAEVHKTVQVSRSIYSCIFPKWIYNPHAQIKKIAYPYLKTKVGGHGLESIAETIKFAEEGFDGVIHLLPFGCMPEVSIRPILQKIQKEKRIPLLSLSLDEHSEKAGLQTRIEAFVDLIKNKKSGQR